MGSPLTQSRGGVDGQRHAAHAQAPQRRPTHASVSVPWATRKES